MKLFKYLGLLPLFLLLLSACSISRQGQEATDKSEEKTVQTQAFLEKDAAAFLQPSTEVPYPEGKNFVATALNDDGIAFGEAYDQGKEAQKYLAALDLKSQEFTKIKDVNPTSEVVNFLINYADKDYLLFEELDQVNQTATYYLWDIHQEKLSTLLDTRHVQVIHQTQVARKDQLFYISYYVEDGHYQMEVFDAVTGSHELIEEENSGSPVIVQGKLHYLLIDNQALKTTLVSYDEATKERKVLDQTEGAQLYYSGLISNGENLLATKLDQTGLTTFVNTAKEPIFSANMVDSPVYKGDFVSYMGERRGQRVKSQYYLLDMKERINYLYEGGPILLSNKGILWIDFKKPEAEIPKGEIYQKENSVMRYLEW